MKLKFLPESEFYIDDSVDPVIYIRGKANDKLAGGLNEDHYCMYTLREKTYYTNKLQAFSPGLTQEEKLEVLELHILRNLL